MSDDELVDYAQLHPAPSGDAFNAIRGLLDRDIRRKEKELVQLRKLPADKYISLEKLRKESSARVLQIAWYRYNYRKKGKPETSRKDSSPAVASSIYHGIDISADNSKLKDVMMPYIKDAFNHQYLSAIEDRKQYDNVSIKLSVTERNLSNLHARIKESQQARQTSASSVAESHTLTGRRGGAHSSARYQYQQLAIIQQQAVHMLDEYEASRATSHLKQKNRLVTQAHCENLLKELSQPMSLDDAASLIHAAEAKDAKVPKVQSSDGADVAASQGTVSSDVAGGVGVGDHSTAETSLRAPAPAPAPAAHVLWDARCRDLQAASPPPSHMHPYSQLYATLPQSNFQSYSQLDKIPTDDVTRAVNAHNRVFGTLLAGQVGQLVSQGSSTTGPTSQWNIMVAPYDLTIPPVNMALLPSIQTSPNTEGDQRSRADRNRNNSNKEEEVPKMSSTAESLLWVSYASQKCRYLNAIDPADPSGKSGWSDKEVASVWMPEGVPSLKETKRAAQDMLGEVHGESLLKELYLRELKSTHVRQDDVTQYVKEERHRISQLAKLFEAESRDSTLEKKRAQHIERITEQELIDRERAAKSLQAVTRGRQSRRKIQTVQAEKRIMSALQVLLMELGQQKGDVNLNSMGSLPSLLSRQTSNSVLPATNASTTGSNGKLSVVSGRQFTGHADLHPTAPVQPKPQTGGRRGHTGVAATVDTTGDKDEEGKLIATRRFVSPDRPYDDSYQYDEKDGVYPYMSTPNTGPFSMISATPIPVNESKMSPVVVSTSVPVHPHTPVQPQSVSKYRILKSPDLTVNTHIDDNTGDVYQETGGYISPPSEAGNTPYTISKLEHQYDDREYNYE